MTDPSIAITAADPGNDERALRRLLKAFHEWMVEHQDGYALEAELAEDFHSLERAAESWAWIARHDETPAGCVLLYGVTDDLAEFRRLWVSPTHRGAGIGRALIRRVVEKADSQGYATLGLTTPPWSEAAQALYESTGFERTTPYPETRLPEKYHDDAIFMKLDLTATDRSTAEW
jgi:ribosomal protein S18 acetylase RimI-like enzyme